MEREGVVEFLKGEFIGKKVEIVESSNKDLVGLKGKIVNEAKNMFEIESRNGTKRVQKKICRFRFPEEGVSVEGKIINYRPEDRLVKKFKDW